MHKVRSALLAVAVVGLGCLPAQAGGLPAPEEVAVRLAPSGVEAPDVLPAGRYQLKVRSPRPVPGLLQLVKPDAGYTRAEFRADARRGAGGRLMANIRFFGGTEVSARGTGALWETLYAGRYWLMGTSARPGGLSIKTIRVHGTPSPSAFPRVTAEATGTDHGLRLSRTAPQSGRMLIRNVSSDIDALILMPLAKGTTYAEFLQWLRRSDGRPPVRLRGVRTTAILSGDAGYVLRYRLWAGDYIVMSLSNLFALDPTAGLRQLFRPLTVQQPAGMSARVAVAGGTEGFRKTPAVARRIGRWLTDADRKPAPLARELASRTLSGY